MDNASLTSLIFGKNNLQRVVSIEPGDEHTEVFTEDDNGNVSSQFIDNAYFILFNECVSNKAVRLKGDLHYHYGMKFKTRESYLKAKNFFRERDHYTIFNPKENFMVRTGLTYFKGLTHTEPSILSFDIETNGLKMNEHSKLYLISNTFRRNGVLERKLFSFDEYPNEGEMLLDWCKWVREKNPSIMVGHNIISYDLPYLANIAHLNGVSLDLGRNGSALIFDKFESRFRKDQTQFINYRKPHIYGREICDTLMVAIKSDIAAKRYETYGLKYIVKKEGLEDKDRVFYDASTIRHNIHIEEEMRKIKAYAEKDADDSLKLYDLLIAPFFYSNQSIPKSFQDVILSASGSQLNSIMVRSYLQMGHSIPKADETGKFEGAISKGYPGLHRNVFKGDVQSLYPSIQMQYEVYGHHKDPLCHTLKILNYFREDRLKNKALAASTGNPYYRHLEQTGKIFINSMYGFMGTNGLNFNDVRSAAKVTEIGRSILLRSMKWAEEKGFQLTSVDTDSIAFRKQDHGEFSEEERVLLLKDLNSLYPELIRFTDDGYYKASLVFAAKNYILYDGEKIKYKGSALKSSTLETALKQFIDAMVKSILNGEELKQQVSIYHEWVKKIFAIDKTNIKDWASKKTLTEKVFSSPRTNEKKILEAVKGLEYAEGDKVWVFFTKNDALSAIENFEEKNYNVDKLLEKLYKCVKRFDTVLDITPFKNYKLKKNKAFLDML